MRHHYTVCNDEGSPVSYGTIDKSKLYCGLIDLGLDDSEGIGRCGPSDGPQCDSCRRLQQEQVRQKNRKPYIGLMVAHALQNSAQLQQTISPVQYLALRETMYAASSNRTAMDIARANLIVSSHSSSSSSSPQTSSSSSSPSSTTTTTTTTTTTAYGGMISAELFQNILLDEVNNSPYIPEHAETTRNAMTATILNEDWDAFVRLADVVDELRLYFPPKDVYWRSNAQNLDAYRSMVVEVFASSSKQRLAQTTTGARRSSRFWLHEIYDDSSVSSVSDLKQRTLLFLEEEPFSVFFSAAERELIRKDFLEDRYDLLLHHDRFDCVPFSPRQRAATATTTRNTNQNNRNSRNSTTPAAAAAVEDFASDRLIADIIQSDEVSGDIVPETQSSGDDEYHSADESGGLVHEIAESEEEEESVAEETTCPICLGANKADSALPCAHVFCSPCLSNWIGRHRGNRFPCPVCRFNTNVA